MPAILAAAEELKPVWAILDDHLDGRDFVAGGRLTMGDIPVGAQYSRYTRLPEIERPAFPNCDAWLARLAARPAFDAHVAMELT